MLFNKTRQYNLLGPFLYVINFAEGPSKLSCLVK